ncbi:insulinase family protein [Acinetobacter sp. 194]|uniref:M16 family metallopeptidase n=1 Tax=Acinetobacter shaoyimingii TaxID=2715164 RepID=UPI00140A67FC|nr:pitrilysin family protein [Acinetobacter shaoyimingii]NHB58267.1 insulinase family protein [Acinetobacter shaoyimingii]
MLTRFKTLTLSLFIISVSADALAGSVLVKAEQNIEEYKLDNGLRVVLAPNDKENKVIINTVYLTGSLNDPKGKGGLAHLLEHLAFKGTQNVKGEEFQRRLDQFTLMTNASTDYYSTKYINVVRPEKTVIDEVLYLESERMDKLVLQEKFVPSEINIVMREREVRMDQPSAVLMDQMWKAAYGNESLGRLPIGDLNELQSIKMDELNKFYRTWYAPNNAVIVIAGKFNKADVLKTIDKNFSPIPQRTVPESAKVPPFNINNMKVKEFAVKKGSDLAKYNVYLNSKNENIQAALSFTPYLYTMQPSGHLYKDMVESGISTNVFATTWLDQHFNLVLLGAIYAPNHHAENVKKQLIHSVEKPQKFNATEVNRIKSMVKNAQETMMTNSSAVADMISEYMVSQQGDWSKFFKEQKQLQDLSVDEINQILTSFLTPTHRISADIQPTPEDQKKAQTLKEEAAVPSQTLDQKAEQAEPLKDAQVYRAEVSQYLKTSKARLDATEKKIQRGKLKNGMKYALFPTKTRDGKTYVSIDVDFGTEQSMFNKADIIGLTSYLLLRASEQYSLQDIADKSIEASGGASASSSDNGMSIEIVAKTEKFDEFFNFILSVMKNPKFEQSQFDLIKSQSLSSLDRPYTEPGTVSAMALSRLTEIYKPGDLRYHFEPDFAKQQLKLATNDQVKALYQQFFAMDHASIAVTGDFDAKKMKKTLKAEFENWNKKQPYQRLTTPYVEYKAQKLHVLSEPREFGSYLSVMGFPLGAFHADAPAMIVFERILGNSQLSSRLAQELREKNALVYGFNSSLSLDEDEESGALGISANYTAGKSAQVSSSVHKVLKALIEKGVTEQEVEAAKADIMKNRVTVLEDERSIHRMLNPQLYRNKDMNARKKRDQEFAKLTKSDVDAAIKKYIHLDRLIEVMADQYGQPTKEVPKPIPASQLAPIPNQAQPAQTQKRQVKPSQTQPLQIQQPKTQP